MGLVLALFVEIRHVRHAIQKRENIHELRGAAWEGHASELHQFIRGIAQVCVQPRDGARAGIESGPANKVKGE